MSIVATVRFTDVDRWDPPTQSPTALFTHPATTLGEIAAVRLGVQVPRRGSAPAGVRRPYLRAANVRRGYVDTSDVKTMHLSESQSGHLRLAAGDLLFVEGSGSITEVGRAALWDGSISDCVHQNSVVRARILGDDVDRNYLLTWFNSRAGNRYIREMATTTSGLFHIGASKLANAPIPVPSLETQRQLVAEVEQARRAARESAANADVLEATAWNDFAARAAHPMRAPGASGLIEVTSFSALDRWDVATGGDELTSPFTLMNLRDVADIRLGTQVPARGSVGAGNDTPYLRAANVQAGHVSLTDVKMMRATQQVIDRLELVSGDVLVVEGNSFEEVGRAAVWKAPSSPVIIQNSVIRVRLTMQGLLPEFVTAWLNCATGRAHARRVATTTSGSLWHLGAAKLADAPIPVPPVEIQQELVANLDRMRHEAEAARRSAERHRERAETLVEDAVYGPG